MQELCLNLILNLKPGRQSGLIQESNSLDVRNQKWIRGAGQRRRVAASWHGRVGTGQGERGVSRVCCACVTPRPAG